MYVCPREPADVASISRPKQDQLRVIRDNLKIGEALEITLKVKHENEMVEVTNDVWPDLLEFGKRSVQITTSQRVPTQQRRPNPIPVVAPILLQRPRPHLGLVAGVTAVIDRPEAPERGRPSVQNTVPDPVVNQPSDRPAQRPGPSTGMGTQNTINNPDRSKSRDSRPSTSRKRSGRSRSRRRRDSDAAYPLTPRSMYDSEPDMDAPARRTRSNAASGASPTAISPITCTPCRQRKVICRRRVDGGSRSVAEMRANIEFSAIPCEECEQKGRACSLEDYFGTRMP
jgi:hypothetical protein